MACKQFENRILAYLENQLPPADRAQITAHLEGCADCRAFARQLEHLDAQLTRALKVPTLPPSFNARLRQRIQTTTVLSDAEIAERKRQLQAEYEAGLARIKMFPLSTRRVLPGFAYVTVFAFIGWLGWRFFPQLVNLLASLFPARPSHNLIAFLTASVIFVALGLAASVFPRRLRRVLFGFVAGKTATV